MSMTDKEFLEKYIFDILQVSEWENSKFPQSYSKNSKNE